MPYGKPLYDYNDLVEFDIEDNGEKMTMHGSVYIVDAFGTFEQSEEASYDVMVDDYPNVGQQCLFKHFPESRVRPYMGD